LRKFSVNLLDPLASIAEILRVVHGVLQRLEVPGGSTIKADKGKTLGSSLICWKTPLAMS
jgi:hypothetical protein